METGRRDPFGMLESDAAADPAGAEAKVNATYIRFCECGPGAFGNSIFADQGSVDVYEDEFDHNKEYR
jgi:hypothetical protein